MKIGLCGREIELIKIEGVSQFSPGIYGKADYDSLQIYICDNIPLRALYHELAELFIYFTGQEQIENFDKESVCNLSAALNEQLEIDNDIDIFDRLKYFSETGIDKEIEIT